MTESAQQGRREDEGESLGHGRHSYVQIPAVDTRASATFYEKVFGWQIRGDGDVHLSFTDATGDMIGAWVTGRAIGDPGVLPYISVDDIDTIVETIAASGGEIVKAIYPEGDLRVATFRDPAGNEIGVWQQPN
jgi:hypothetical protein